MRVQVPPSAPFAIHAKNWKYPRNRFYKNTWGLVVKNLIKSGISGLIFIGLGLAVIPAFFFSFGGEAQATDLYEFAAPPGSVNRLFWVNTETGQVGACQYQQFDDKDSGRTHCFESGGGARRQGRGLYGLTASNHETENGVIRVNRDTGEMSFCWVSDSTTVCTSPNR